jgi:hypothetical protein
MSQVQKTIALLSIVLVSGFTGPAFGQDKNATMVSFESTVASLAERSDYESLNSLSKIYLALANAHKTSNDMRTACAALSQSLEYYREAMANEPHTPSYERAVSLDDREDSGMREVRAQFGCSLPDGTPLQHAARR